MPGLMFSEITSSPIKPIWHDVIKELNSGWSKDVARWSIVFFADYTDMRNVHFEEAHAIKR